MVWPLLSDKRARLAAAIGGVVFLASVSFLPIGVPILLSVIGVLVGVQKPVPPPVVDGAVS
jgi:hypothetical protein